MINKKKIFIIAAMICGILIVLPEILSAFNNYGHKRVLTSEFYHYLKDGKIDSMVLEGMNVKFTLRERPENVYVSLLPQTAPQAMLHDVIMSSNAKVQIIPVSSSNRGILETILWFVSFILPFVILFYLFFQMRGGGDGGGIGGFLGGEGRFQNVNNTGERPNNKFSDIAGVDEAVEEVKEVVDYLKEPGKFVRMGARVPKGCLLCGPPGTGKTLLARCIAGEANVPFFSVSGSEFNEVFVGMGAKRVRDLFSAAKKASPCIVFIDEIDAIGKKRGANLQTGVNDERENTLNQLLVAMDGFANKTGIVVIGATNIHDVLDDALTRPGRFDRRVHITLPDISGRTAILNIAVKKGKVKLSPEVDLSIIARSTPGFSGADLDNLINEGALLAARRDRVRITKSDIDDARDKILMGHERKAAIIPPETNRITAYHEAGHAILGWILPHADPLYKVTIIPRGSAMGVTMNIPESDVYFYSKAMLETRLRILMAGRAAEKIILGDKDYTSGASHDFKVATEIARKMVMELGMSDNIGPIYVANDNAFYQKYSEETLRKVDNEIRSIIDHAMGDAMQILHDNIDKLHLLANALLEYETLDSDEVKELFETNKVNVSSKHVELTEGDGIIPDFGNDMQ